eukprot:jgi/Hompol1/3630/HPOL_003310-RA
MTKVTYSLGVKTKRVSSTLANSSDAAASATLSIPKLTRQHTAALELAEKSGNERAVLANLEALSDIFAGTEDWGKAMMLSKRQLQLADKLGEHRLAIMALKRLANACSSMNFAPINPGTVDLMERAGNIDLAISYIEQRLQRAIKLGDSEEEIDAYLALSPELISRSELELELGDEDTAQIFLEKASASLKTVLHKVNESTLTSDQKEDAKGQISMNHGIIEKIHGRIDSGIRAIMYALRIFQKQGDLAQQAKAFFNLAICYDAKGDTKFALEAALRKAKRDVEQLAESKLLTEGIRQAQIRKDLRTEFQLRGDRGQIFSDLDMLAEAIDDLREQKQLGQKLKVSDTLLNATILKLGNACQAADCFRSILKHEASLDDETKLQAYCGFARTLPHDKNAKNLADKMRICAAQLKRVENLLQQDSYFTSSAADDDLGSIGSGSEEAPTPMRQTGAANAGAGSSNQSTRLRRPIEMPVSESPPRLSTHGGNRTKTSRERAVDVISVSDGDEYGDSDDGEFPALSKLSSRSVTKNTLPEKQARSASQSHSAKRLKQSR